MANKDIYDADKGLLISFYSMSPQQLFGQGGQQGPGQQRPAPLAEKRRSKDVFGNDLEYVKYNFLLIHIYI